MSTAADALATLAAAAADGRLDELATCHGVRLLGAFGSAVRARGRAPEDLDLAVSLTDGSEVLALVGALVDLTGFERIDLCVIDGAEPVVRAEALVGVPLYEAEPGLFATTQMAALAERRDTAHLRRLDLRLLAE